MTDGRRQFIEPGAGDFLKLQVPQAFEGARCRLCVIGGCCSRVANPRSEIHQASAKAKQYGGEAGSGKGQGFGAGHWNRP